MSLIKRKASVRWKSGAGTKGQKLKMEKSIMLLGAKLEISTEEEVEGAPAAFIAAAHASSFSMTLSKELRAIKMDSGDFLTTATVTVEEQAAGWTVTNVHLDILAFLPKITQCEFIDATVRAKTKCSVSRLVRANISMNAKLDK
jgi:osmotically inducible protein OsmC